MPFTATVDLTLEVDGQQAELLRSANVDTVLIAGSKGEGSSLTASEGRDLAVRGAEAAGQPQLWVHVGRNSRREAAALAAPAA